MAKQAAAKIAPPPVGGKSDTGTSSVGKRLLTVKELAEYVGIPVKTIYNQVSNCERPFPIKCIRIGGHVRFDLRAVDANLDKLNEATK